MKQKTYGVEDLVDWQAQIRVGSARVIVHFSGGAMTSYGVTPAEFTTTEPFYQHVIENSRYFKEGKIKLLREIEVEGKATPSLGGEAAEHSGLSAEGTVAEQPKAESANTIEGFEMEEITVTCLNDAQAYLKENYKVPMTKTRTWEMAKSTGEEYGIIFKIAEEDQEE